MVEEGKIIEGKLIRSIVAKNLGDVSIEYAEIGLDTIFKEGIAKDIPILNSIISVAKVGFNIRDRLYLKKIIDFLSQIGQTTQEQRNEFVSKYCDDTRRFEETILSIIEQADRIEKATFIGKVFKACIIGRITYEDAITLSTMINRAIWSDIEKMLKNNYTYDSQRLFNCGLLSLNWKKRIEQDLNQNQIQRVAFDGLKYDENKYTKILKTIATQ